MREPHPLLRGRSAGVLLHLSSLPGRLGCGDLGPAARRFLDWLAEAGQSWWQMLPVAPVGPGESPYSGASAHAGEALYLSLEDLAADGLLDGERLSPPRALRTGPLDHAGLRAFRSGHLRDAFARWKERGGPRRPGFRRFRKAQDDWLRDWARFRVVRRLEGGRAWTAWPEGLRRRDPEALADLDEELGDEILFEEFLQFQFERQWAALRAHARERGVRLLGDVPIFVVHDSADVWAAPDHFLLDAQGRPRFLTGVPPDYFSADGQLWGHPHYRWPTHRKSGWRWWIRRFELQLRLFDALRVDHFIGFHHAWRVPADARTAREGRYVRTPGRALLGAVRAALGGLPLVAEDLGAITPQVHRLRDDLGLPGMRVLQFGFGEDRYHQAHNCPPDSVVYPGTHDNDTVLGWARSRPAAERNRALAYAGLERGELERLPAGLVRVAWSAPSRAAIAAMQDLLGLGDEARMNRPGTARGNWRWRLENRQLSGKLARRLRALTETYERLP